jgi:hypothetical protein
MRSRLGALAVVLASTQGFTTSTVVSIAFSVTR